jgi:exodeoxyribonuclease V alpha subunit
MNQPIILRGNIEKVFYAGPKFSAGRLRGTDGKSHSFAGNLFATEGQHIALAGRWETHPDYGRQFKVEHVEIEMPSGAEGLAQFIANHPEVKGIGPSRAAKIVQACGDDFERVLLESPERIAQAAKVPLPTIQNLRNVWITSRKFNAAMTWLSAFGLTHHQVTTLVEKLGNNALAILRDDPYRLMREIKGLGFKKVDQIARKMGTVKEHLPRVRAGVLHCVQEALDQGDCWVEYEDLIDRANTLLIMDCLDSRERIEKELDVLIDTERLACNDLGGRFVVSLPNMHQMESDLARWFGGAHESNPAFAHVDDIDGMIARTGASLNARQRDAVHQALSSRISVISGGAGTGKTYTVSTLTAICDDLDLSVELTAPTGKAARRLEESSGRGAMTIHRLLGYDGRTFAKGPDDVVDADLLIVDEVSMVDVPLAWHLFRSLDLVRTAVVLVGDHNQLPPVGPGNILRDLIQSRATPTTILDKCVRQAGVLKENATAILTGEVCKTSEKHADGRCDWYLVDQFTDPSGVAKCLRELFENVLEEKLGFDLLRDVQVLTPTHKGPIGTKALNEELQRLVQRKSYGVEVPPHAANRRTPLLVGDKVIQTRNNYEIDVMNGTVGIVRDISTKGAYTVDFDGQMVEIERGSNNLRDIQLAYALTTHRAQGSEFPCAIVIMHKSTWFMNRREAFYTAVTRAKQCVIIIGDRWGIRTAAAKQSAYQRKTWLSFLLPEKRFAAARG